MKQAAWILVLMLLQCSMSSYGQHIVDAALLQDGPYVFYRDGGMAICSVADGRALLSGYTLRSGRRKSIKVGFADHPDWDFKVRLKRTLETEPSVYLAVEKLLVVSDIEGEFEGFRKLMIACGVIDKRYHWMFGKGHLLIDGDLFDRGKQVPEFLWLLYHLEQQATKKGGKVHTLLGNHDVMNLSGDLRFVQGKYLRSAKLMGVDYMDLYSENTELGRWLRSKNIIEKIGDRLFMHAGLSSNVAALRMSVPEINSLCRPYFASRKKDIPENLQVFFGKNSPFWYRGYFLSPRMKITALDSILKFYQVSQVVVGHTILERNIAMYYGGKVIGVDVDTHLGHSAAALLENGQWWILDGQGKRTKLVYKQENDQIRDADIL